jgi:hypothetical protein
MTSTTPPKLTPVEQAMLWERMSGERLSAAERQHLLNGGAFIPPTAQSIDDDHDPMKMFVTVDQHPSVEADDADLTSWSIDTAFTPADIETLISAVNTAAFESQISDDTEADLTAKLTRWLKRRTEGLQHG